MAQTVKRRITLSIVLYHSSYEQVDLLLKAILSFHQSVFVYLVDNSSNDALRILQSSARVEYEFLGRNIGFGAGHNVAIKKAIADGSEFHFIINPDIELKSDVFNPLVNYLSENEAIGLAVPLIKNLDGTPQFLPMLVSSPLSLVKRKLHAWLGWYSNFIERYELRSLICDRNIEIPIASGCFILARTEALKKVGCFDESFFMYFEDWDLSRRVNKYYRSVLFCHSEVFHGYESGANKSFRLLLIYLKSGVKYFNKWGWIRDSERDTINRRILRQ